MKICLVSNLYPPLGQGGAEIYVGRLATALAEDHQVVVVTSEPGFHLAPRREVTREGIVIYRLARLNIAHNVTLPLRVDSPSGWPYLRTGSSLPPAGQSQSRAGQPHRSGDQPIALRPRPTPPTRVLPAGDPADPAVWPRARTLSACQFSLPLGGRAGWGL